MIYHGSGEAGITKHGYSTNPSKTSAPKMEIPLWWLKILEIFRCPFIFKSTLKMAPHSMKASRWITGWGGVRELEHHLNTRSPVREIIIDPDVLFPDANRSNNVWEAED